ncbi:hypothetical protein DFJ77DRAFT_510401 [Powellomyces hirtus]|nr:hypothetical protein DFJ77DRAFT_510401 [Powellomyces hirtus]
MLADQTQLEADIEAYVRSLSKAELEAAIEADKELLDKYWADESNWTMKTFYHCADDPRVFVPKRPKWAGWTINMASNSDKATQLKKSYNILRKAVARD